MLGYHFGIYTDHKSLKNLISQTIQTPYHEKWLTNLLVFELKNLFTPGKENVIAGALLRINSDDKPAYLTFSTCQPGLISQLYEFYKSHTIVRLLIKKLSSIKTLEDKKNLIIHSAARHIIL